MIVRDIVDGIQYEFDKNVTVTSEDGSSVEMVNYKINHNPYDVKENAQMLTRFTGITPEICIPSHVAKPCLMELMKPKKMAEQWRWRYTITHVMSSLSFQLRHIEYRVKVIGTEHWDTNNYLALDESFIRKQHHEKSAILSDLINGNAYEKDENGKLKHDIVLHGVMSDGASLALHLTDFFPWKFFGFSDTKLGYDAIANKMSALKNSNVGYNGKSYFEDVEWSIVEWEPSDGVSPSKRNPYDVAKYFYVKVWSKNANQYISRKFETEMAEIGAFPVEDVALNNEIRLSQLTRICQTQWYVCSQWRECQSFSTVLQVEIETTISNIIHCYHSDKKVVTTAPITDVKCDIEQRKDESQKDNGIPDPDIEKNNIICINFTLLRHGAGDDFDVSNIGQKASKMDDKSFSNFRVNMPRTDDNIDYIDNVKHIDIVSKYDDPMRSIIVDGNDDTTTTSMDDVLQGAISSEKTYTKHSGDGNGLLDNVDEDGNMIQDDEDVTEFIAVSNADDVASILKRMSEEKEMIDGELCGNHIETDDIGTFPTSTHTLISSSNQQQIKSIFHSKHDMEENASAKTKEELVEIAKSILSQTSMGNMDDIDHDMIESVENIARMINDDSVQLQSLIDTSSLYKKSNISNVFAPQTSVDDEVHVELHKSTQIIKGDDKFAIPGWCKQTLNARINLIKDKQKTLTPVILGNLKYVRRICFFLDEDQEEDYLEFVIPSLYDDDSDGILVKSFKEECNLLLAVRDFQVAVHYDIICGHFFKTYDWKTIFARANICLGDLIPMVNISRDNPMDDKTTMNHTLPVIESGYLNTKFKNIFSDIVYPHITPQDVKNRFPNGENERWKRKTLQRFKDHVELSRRKLTGDQSIPGMEIYKEEASLLLYPSIENECVDNISMTKQSSFEYSLFRFMDRSIFRPVHLERKITSSSNVATVESIYPNLKGIDDIDSLVAIRLSNGTLPSFSLKYVSGLFLDDNKMDIGIDRMNKCWDSKQYWPVIAYCDWDCILVLALMTIKNMIANHSALARCSYLSAGDMVNFGQQKRIYSKNAVESYARRIVLLKSSVISPVIYSGGFVGVPVGGVYPCCVSCLDYVAYYVTTIMAHNLCFSSYKLPWDSNFEPFKMDGNNPHGMLMNYRKFVRNMRRVYGEPEKLVRPNARCYLQCQRCQCEDFSLLPESIFIFDIVIPSSDVDDQNEDKKFVTKQIDLRTYNPEKNGESPIITQEEKKHLYVLLQLRMSSLPSHEDLNQFGVVQWLKNKCKMNEPFTLNGENFLEKSWLKKLVFENIEGSIPSQSLFSSCFRSLKPEACQNCQSKPWLKYMNPCYDESKNTDVTVDYDPHRDERFAADSDYLMPRSSRVTFQSDPESSLLSHLKRSVNKKLPNGKEVTITYRSDLLTEREEFDALTDKEWVDERFELCQQHFNAEAKKKEPKKRKKKKQESADLDEKKNNKQALSLPGKSNGKQNSTISSKKQNANNQKLAKQEEKEEDEEAEAEALKNKLKYTPGIASFVWWRPGQFDNQALYELKACLSLAELPDFCKGITDEEKRRVYEHSDKAMESLCQSMFKNGVKQFNVDTFSKYADMSSKQGNQARFNMLFKKKFFNMGDYDVRWRRGILRYGLNTKNVEDLFVGRTALRKIQGSIIDNPLYFSASEKKWIDMSKKQLYYALDSAQLKMKENANAYYGASGALTGAIKNSYVACAITFMSRNYIRYTTHLTVTRWSPDEKMFEKIIGFRQEALKHADKFVGVNQKFFKRYVLEAPFPIDAKSAKQVWLKPIHSIAQFAAENDHESLVGTRTIYGDTDSIMPMTPGILLGNPLLPNNEMDEPRRQCGIDWGISAANYVSSHFRMFNIRWMKIEFEKMIYPFGLAHNVKKKYIGGYWTKAEKRDKYLVRSWLIKRDIPNFLQNLRVPIMDILMTTMNGEKVIQLFAKEFEKLIATRGIINDIDEDVKPFSKSQAIKKLDYANVPGHVMANNRLKKSAPGTEHALGERVDFVICNVDLNIEMLGRSITCEKVGIPVTYSKSGKAEQKDKVSFRSYTLKQLGFLIKFQQENPDNQLIKDILRCLRVDISYYIEKCAATVADVYKITKCPNPLYDYPSIFCEKQSTLALYLKSQMKSDIDCGVDHDFKIMPPKSSFETILFTAKMRYCKNSEDDFILDSDGKKMIEQIPERDYEHERIKFNQYVAEYIQKNWTDDVDATAKEKKSGWSFNIKKSISMVGTDAATSDKKFKDDAKAFVKSYFDDAKKIVTRMSSDSELGLISRLRSGLTANMVSITSFFMNKKPSFVSDNSVVVDNVNVCSSSSPVSPPKSPQSNYDDVDDFISSIDESEITSLTTSSKKRMRNNNSINTENNGDLEMLEMNSFFKRACHQPLPKEEPQREVVLNPKKRIRKVTDDSPDDNSNTTSKDITSFFKRVCQ